MDFLFETIFFTEYVKLTFNIETIFSTEYVIIVYLKIIIDSKLDLTDLLEI